MKPRQPTGAVRRQGANSGQVFLRDKGTLRGPSSGKGLPVSGPLQPPRDQAPPPAPEDRGTDDDYPDDRSHARRDRVASDRRNRRCQGRRWSGPRPAMSQLRTPRGTRAVIRLRCVFRSPRSHVRLRANSGGNRARHDRGPPARDLALPGAAAGRRTARAWPQCRLVAAPEGLEDRSRARRRAAVAQGRHPKPNSVVQGPRRRGRSGPRSHVRLRHPRLCVDGQSRRCNRRGGGGGRPARLRVRTRRPRAGEDQPCPRLRGDRRPHRRHVRRAQSPVSRSGRRGRLGLRQRQPAAVLRRRQQDAGPRDRGAARLAPA